MPQQVQPKTFVCRDSLQLDTIWLDVDALPAKLFNPIDTPELVLFHVDSAIAHQVNWNHVDTFSLHRMGLKDTAYQKSFFNTYYSKGKGGVPEKSTHPTEQLILSSSVLIILFASFSILYTTSKVRLERYFLSIFNTRRFKEYITEEDPGFIPTMPILYLLQSLLVGTVISAWLFWNNPGLSIGELIGFTALVIGAYAMVPLLRNGMIMLLGAVFMIQKDARKHVFVSYLSHSLLFMLVLPLAILMAIQIPYLESFFNLALYSCFTLSMGYQLFKMIQNAHLPDVGALLYIFLYFCTLEILPLFLIYKVVSIYA
jgi:hypothetical protein